MNSRGDLSSRDKKTVVRAQRDDDAPQCADYARLPRELQTTKRRNPFHIRLERAALHHGMGYVPPSVRRDVPRDARAGVRSQRKVDEYARILLEWLFIKGV